MKNLKLLSKFFILISSFTFVMMSMSYSNEPSDIWNLPKNSPKLNESNNETDENKVIIKSTLESEILKDDFNEEQLDDPDIQLIGLFDPIENDLNIDMWSYSDGDQVTSILNKILKKNLSSDANELLKITLLTNSYAPNTKISIEEFTKFKINFLIKNNDLNLMREFIIKNQNIPHVDNIIKDYVDQNLLSGNLDKSCDLFDEIQNIFVDQYLDKFKIYCYIINDKQEDAQLYYDLKKELGLSDRFFDDKFDILMGYNTENSNKISTKNLLNFHLSHRTNKKFDFIPNDKTPKFIWKYLSNYNLLEGVADIDLENVDKIQIIETATHDGNYSEKELLYLYKRFQFSIDQLINASETFRLLPSYEGRALLYQKMLLANETNEKILFAQKLKNSLIKDDIGNAFKIELSNELKKLDEINISSDLTSFYENNIISNNTKPKKIRYNNKIIHQSKLLSHLKNNFDVDKAQKDTNDILKKIKSNKKYIFSNKDKMLIDTMRYDGVKIKKNYANLYEKTSNVPIDLQVLVNNQDVGMILLRLVEIIGEDKIENLGTETLYFIVTVLNEINLDRLRNNILLEILPIKI